MTDQKSMFKKQIKHSEEIAGTSFNKVVVKENYQTLLNALGNPTVIGSPDNKIQLQWQFINSQNKEQVFTIYDYKSDCPIKDVTDWHIGSKGMSNEKIIRHLKEYGLEAVIV